MPVDIRHCHHSARKRKLMIKLFTLDDEVGVTIKSVKAARSQLLTVSKRYFCCESLRSLLCCISHFSFRFKTILLSLFKEYSIK